MHFSDGADVSSEYSYDVNGNLIKDLNIPHSAVICLSMRSTFGRFAPRRTPDAEPPACFRSSSARLLPKGRKNDSLSGQRYIEYARLQNF